MEARERGEIWQDREIRFDVRPSLLQISRGEHKIELIENVEDSKGNRGDPGQLLITSLRLIWCSRQSKRTNLSIGFSTILRLSGQGRIMQQRGRVVEKLYIQTNFKGSRFEFIFTYFVRTTSRLYKSVHETYKGYDTTRMYRDYKLRTAIISGKELRTLPREQIFDTITGVWNLSADQGCLGTFMLTNVRVVWFANLSENYNVSIPYIQVNKIQMRASKFGQALVLDIYPYGGGYELGFRIDPVERLEEVRQIMVSLWKVYSKDPVMGLEQTVESSKNPSDSDIEIESDDEDPASPITDVSAVYNTEDSGGADREPVFSDDLGVAIESLRPGVSIAQLWSITDKIN